MSTWLKVLLGVTALGVVLAVVAGFLIVDSFKKGVAETEEAAARGKGFGFNNTLEACVRAGVRLTGSCNDKQLGCVLKTDAFLWGCVEAADYDAAYCAEVPASDGGAVTRRWARKTCAAHGQPDNESCAFALQVLPSFCTYREQVG